MNDVFAEGYLNYANTIETVRELDSWLESNYGISCIELPNIDHLYLKNVSPKEIDRVETLKKRIVREKNNLSKASIKAVIEVADIYAKPLIRNSPTCYVLAF
jgi:hypothetical protein